MQGSYLSIWRVKETNRKEILGTTINIRRVSNDTNREG